MRVCCRRTQSVDDVAVQFADRGHRGRQLVGRHESVQQLRAGQTPVRKLIHVVVGDSDHPTDDHHRQPVGHRIHPLDAAVDEPVGPESLEGLRYQRLQRAHPFGGELGQHQLAVRGVDGIVGGDQNVGGSPESFHEEWFDLTVGGVSHGRGQIGGEILRPAHHLVDRGSAADQMKAGAADLMHGSRGTHPVIQRIRILDGGRAEELSGGDHAGDRHRCSSLRTSFGVLAIRIFQTCARSPPGATCRRTPPPRARRAADRH